MVKNRKKIEFVIDFDRLFRVPSTFWCYRHIQIRIPDQPNVTLEINCIVLEIGIKEQQSKIL